MERDRKSQDETRKFEPILIFKKRVFPGLDFEPVLKNALCLFLIEIYYDLMILTTIALPNVSFEFVIGF